MAEDELQSRRNGRELLCAVLEQHTGEDFARLPLRGQCMDPLLVDGDRVEVTPPPEAPRVGQILVAESAQGELVCHRYIGRDREGRMLLAGDRGGRVDVVEAQAVVGRAVAVERTGQLSPLDGGWFLRWVDGAIARLRRWSWRLAPVSPRILRAPRRPIDWIRRFLLNARARTVT